jgi:hypothetical protein
VFPLGVFRKKVHQELRSRKFKAFIIHKRGKKFNPNDRAASFFYTDPGEYKADNIEVRIDEGGKANKTNDTNEDNTNKDNKGDSSNKACDVEEPSKSSKSSEEVEEEESAESSESSEYKSKDPDILAAEALIARVRAQSRQPAVEDVSTSSDSSEE